MALKAMASAGSLALFGSMVPAVVDAMFVDPLEVADMEDEGVVDTRVLQMGVRLEEDPTLVDPSDVANEEVVDTQCVQFKVNAPQMQRERATRALSCLPFDKAYTFNGGNCRSQFSAADFDGDGDLDLFHVSRYDTKPHVPGALYYENVGHAADARWQLVGSDCTGWSASSGGSPDGCLPAGPTSPVHDILPVTNEPSVECADFDADGDYDCLIGLPGSRLIYARNDGTSAAPAFTKVDGTDPASIIDETWLKSQIQGAPWCFSCYDFDSDGDIDCFLFSTYRGRATYLRNVGTATQPSWEVDLASNLNNIDTIAGWSERFGGNTYGDLDGDGDMDLFVGLKNQVLFIENVGTLSSPQFEDPVDVSNAKNPFNSCTVANTCPMTTRYFHAVQMMDWDGDGDLDMLSSDDTCEIRMYENVGTWTAPSFVLAASSSNTAACDGSLAPTPVPAPPSGGGGGGTATAFGDPHVKNVEGHEFEIRRAGEHAMLTVPQGASAAHALLTVRALVKPGATRCSGGMYITRVAVGGSWLGDVPDMVFSAGVAPPGSLSGAGLRVGNSSDLTAEEFLSKVPSAMAKISAPEDADRVPAAVNGHATTLVASLKLGPGVGVKVSWVSERTPARTLADSLWLSITGLSKVGTRIGGLLGSDDHQLASELEPDCAASGELLTVSGDRLSGASEKVAVAVAHMEE